MADAQLVKQFLEHRDVLMGFIFWPLEFRLSSPVQPNRLRLQQILSGETLKKLQGKRTLTVEVLGDAAAEAAEAVRG